MEILIERVECPLAAKRNQGLKREVLGDFQRLASERPIIATDTVGVPTKQECLVGEVGPGRTGIEAMRHVWPPLAIALYV